MRLLLHLCAAALTAAVVVGPGSTAIPPTAEREPLRVMTFNIWVGGEGGKLPPERIADAIRAAKADVVGLQEVSGREVAGVRPDNGRKVADLLGWDYLKQPGHSTAIATRHRIVAPTSGGHGALIQTAAGRRFLLFNVHLNHAPYQPYQLLGIPYHDGRFIRTADEAVAEARAARGGEIAGLLADIDAAAAEHWGVPVVVTGDFNEPSYLDWTPAATAAGRCPVAVAWPSTRALSDAGFVDAYRARHPNPVQSPGHTWTPTTAPDDAKDRHDRIDFVLVRAGPADQSTAAVEAAQVVGESPGRADVVVAPWPSDHRAVVVTLSLRPPPAR